MLSRATGRSLVCPFTPPLTRWLSTLPVTVTLFSQQGSAWIEADSGCDVEEGARPSPARPRQVICDGRNS
jgi:hypothetical protein